MVLLMFGLVSALSAADPAYLELMVQDETLRGKLIAMDKSSAWLMSREGKLNELSVRDIKGLKRISSRFEPLSSAEVRDALQREFGKGFEVAGSEHYLVCAPLGKAREYAQLFEGIYRAFHGYFSVRGFRLASPEFPLVAIVFPDHKSFDEYCKGDGLRAFRGLMGYYLRTSNRVALFDPGDGKTARHSDDDSVLSGFVNASIEAGLADTMIHEATHQVAFNTGLHSRVGENPKWIVEGLATVFESPGIRESASQRGKVFQRVNRERYVWFQNFAQSRRKRKSLADFVSEDTMFQTAALDAYAQAWALSFYLIETRSSKYAGYLKAIASRDPLKAYPKEERLSDFKNAFGSDLNMLEADFLRFISRLEE
jgi:hypothetical protein